MEKIQSRQGQGRVSDAPSGHWVYRVMPQAMWPYAQLARWDRPIGWQLLLWPCWWSAALAAAAYARPGAPLEDVLPSLWHLGLFLIGAIAMRGAGCTYNDIVDQRIDDAVERTRSRPLPSGQVSRKQAWAFLIAQALVGLLVLVQFNIFAIALGFASLAVVAIYPFAKRFTDWPQLFLGLAFSWGALMGWAADFESLTLAPVLLYFGSILWVIGYDTIYAHQDKEDDAIVGVRSTARLFGDRTRQWLIALYGGALLFFAVAFALAEVPMPALAGLIAAGAHMARQIRVIDIDNPDQCLALFRSNNVVGWLIFLGLIGGSLWAVISPQF
ncbi:4-hydroxybenzoate octaprenyltransferase [Nitratireductor aquimarinus]|uniref:4-hydroxybenzoate octaprenyltransferase n=1 Tax=Alphaproteobacteria TaxID=28211 RepID=UPI0019D39368|nr:MULTISPECIES: 4-hydroxybenzoate octaprenyltransferase [Alphaproteobacteria]MBY6020594.1 4-hydroxybenzoate octaprenyltransferase [Nitratireductor sp. DP7N14-4]MBN7755808.1 4-hydroxybenzoate octaprenyltransferase [Nitratireductor aquimarinus]MBN7777546.1 4-hydroxybenzoate octaprenyltransferase [Nitratireductor pacificus]MBN7781539.1 4-hydroxybenzoate octaprenyltransferase [Nitratireductor pacificus]MBN7790345.1 4-hydroxybenzoate octaprenyltransferase [Nitratireductor aquimarinus]